jgi:hypothetical protein
MKNFDDFLENKELDEETQILADLILETGFPINEFVEWYAETGISLREEIVAEGFWGGAAAGAAAGSVLGPGGAMLGGLAGGLAGRSQWGQNLMAGIKGGISGWKNNWQTNAKLGQLNAQRENALKQLANLKTIADDPALNNVKIVAVRYRNLINRIIERLSIEVQLPMMRSAQPQAQQVGQTQGQAQGAGQPQSPTTTP